MIIYGRIDSFFRFVCFFNIKFIIILRPIPDRIRPKVIGPIGLSKQEGR